MQGFKIKLFDSLWNDYFEFVDDPSIEIKRDFSEGTIYEKPGFDFIAWGQLFTRIEQAQLQGLCSVEDIEVYQNDILVWKGVIRLSNIICTYFSDRGETKEIEVLDKNFNHFFKTLNDYEIDLKEPFDLDCSLTNTPPLISLEFIKLTDILITTIRPVYKFWDALQFVIRVITRGQVIPQSLFFTNGDGVDWCIATGQALRNTLGDYKSPVLTYQALKDFLFKSYNIWAYHFIDDDGNQIVRFEPYQVFFVDGDIIIYDAVRSVSFQGALDRQYSTASIGDQEAIPDNIDPNIFVDFEYVSFDPQQIVVNRDCGTGNDFDIAFDDILVDSTKIHIALNWDWNDDPVLNDPVVDYDADVFVFETDLPNNSRVSLANPYNRSEPYYNASFTNNVIIPRHFEGTNPETVTNSGVRDVFSVSQPNDKPIVLQVAFPNFGSLTTNASFKIYFSGLTKSYDPNLVTTDPVIPSFGTATNGNFFTLGPQESTRYTCSITSLYRFSIDWTIESVPVNLLVIMANGTTIQARAVIEIYDAGNVLQNTLYSPFVDMIDTSTSQLLNRFTNVIKWVSDQVNIQANWYALFSLESNFFDCGTIAIASDTVGFSIRFDSSVSVEDCPYFEHVTGIDIKKPEYLTSFEAYPVNDFTWDKIRANPFIPQRINSYRCDLYYRWDGFIDTIKRNLVTGSTDLAIVAGETFISPELCWVLNECGNAYWRDECIWIDAEFWCDA